MSGDKMIGRKVVDHHKNTATSKHVNDRLRRRVKRVERERMSAQIKLGSFFSALTGR
jgi:methionine synthase II (cobalamin-independent)